MCFLALFYSFIPSSFELRHLLIASPSRWHYVTRKHYPGASCLPLSATSSEGVSNFSGLGHYLTFLVILWFFFPSLECSHHISAGWKYGGTKTGRDNNHIMQLAQSLSVSQATEEDTTEVLSLVPYLYYRAADHEASSSSVTVESVSPPSL